MQIRTQELSTLTKFFPLKNTPVGMLTLEEVAVAVEWAVACIGASVATPMVQLNKATSDAKISFFIRIALILVYSPPTVLQYERGVGCYATP